MKIFNIGVKLLHAKVIKGGSLDLPERNGVVVERVVPVGLGVHPHVGDV